MFFRWLFGFAVALAFTAAQAQGVKLDRAWVRATVAQQKSTAAFMRIQAAQSVRLVEASSPVAERVEIHSMAMNGDVMTMRPVPELSLSQGQTIELSPSGLHLMLFGLKKALIVGDAVPITVTFIGPGGQRERLALNAEVRPLSGP